MKEAKISHSQIVLVDCDTTIRNGRLVRERNQPELANPQMDCWAAYMRGQADALFLPIIDTSNASSGESLKQLHAVVFTLLEQAETEEFAPHL